MKIIGLTGKRGVGKSEVAKILVAEGMEPAHAFEPGKVASVAMFEYCGADRETAKRMVYGDLKDAPSPILPNNATPRYWMEELGFFMGRTMGPDWTLGTVLRKAAGSDPDGKFIVESVAYEADVLRAAGGRIYRVERPGVSNAHGHRTDAAESEIEVDGTIVNDGTLEDLRRKVLAIL